MKNEICMILKGIPLVITLAAVLFLSACSGEANDVSGPRPASDGSVAAGRRLIESYGCGSCHTIPGIPGANAVVGPSLDHFYRQMMIAGALPNTDANLVKWIQRPQEIVPGDAMPDMGVTEEQARDIAAYLYHQPTIADWFGQ